MTPRLQSSTRLLSILIQLTNGVETASTRIFPIRRSLRILSTPSSPRLPKTNTQAPQPLSDKNSAQTEVDISGGGSHGQRSRGAKAPVSATPIEIQPAPIEVSSTDGGVQIGRFEERNSSDPAAPYRKYLESEKTDPRRRTGQPASTRKANAGSINGRTAGSKDESAKRAEPQPATDEEFQRPREHWQIQKDALKKKFGKEGWSPRKKLSPDTMEGIRALHEQYPQRYTTPVLAEQFKVSPEAIRRILKSRWRASPEKMEERRARWAKRHDRIWDAQAEMGLRPQRTKDRKPEGPESLDDIIPPTRIVGP